PTARGEAVDELVRGVTQERAQAFHTAGCERLRHELSPANMIRAVAVEGRDGHPLVERPRRDAEALHELDEARAQSSVGQKLALPLVGEHTHDTDVGLAEPSDPTRAL